MIFLFLFSISSAKSRKRYVKEKLFNQMLNELCVQRCEKQDAANTNTEYSDKFNGKDFQNDADRQVHIHTHIIWIFGSVPFLIKSVFFLLIEQNILNYNFKLYGKNSNAISFWNIAIDNGRGHFKVYRQLTKLNSECLDEQWR